MRKMMFLKLLIVSVLTGVILLALLAVYGVLASRQSYRSEAITSIGESYAGQQTVTGPVLVEPYVQMIDTVSVDDKGKRQVTTSRVETSALVFPAELTITGEMRPSERRHGLYKVAVYEAGLHLSGTIHAPAQRLEGKVEWGEPYLGFAVTDVRGIVGMPTVMVNGRAADLRHGADAVRGQDADRPWQPQLQVLVATGRGGEAGELSFAVDLTLAGTQVLALSPVGDLNRFALRSRWASPLFAGQFLPRTREVSKDGFTAAWEISSLASGTQRQMLSHGAGTAVDQVNVSLLDPVDPYKMADRAVKYGVLFVLLTFGGFFLFEVMKSLPIHPIQYLLVGFGLAMFFLLLVSLSEHLPFVSAYVIASVACLGLLTFYMSAVLRSVVRGGVFGGMLALLYAAIYGLLISEDNALLLGSVLLFLILAGIIVVTRKVDWYRSGAEPGGTRPPPPLNTAI